MKCIIIYLIYFEDTVKGTYIKYEGQMFGLAGNLLQLVISFL